MYQLSKLNPKSRDFITYITNSGLGRKKLTSLCIAKAVADKLELPSSDVDDIRQFFRNTLEIRVSQYVSKLNELTVIDYDTILSYVGSVYAWRYRVAHKSQVVLCQKEETAVCDFFGISSVIDSDGLAEISGNPVQAMKLYNEMIGLLSDFDSMEC